MNKQGKNGIEWTDWTLNPITGCLGHGGTPEAPNRCSYCYAYKMAIRFRKKGLKHDPFMPTFHPHRLEEIAKIKEPSMTFLCSASDMFGGYIPREWILEILETIKIYPQHVFQLLTKNPKRYAEFDFPKNCWLGTSFGGTGLNLLKNGKRLHDFTKSTKGKENINFISWEPIQARLGGYRDIHGHFDSHKKLDWLIMGAMTGPGSAKYAPEPQWIEDAVEECRKHDIPIFMKGSLEPYWKGTLIQEWPNEKD